MEHFAQRGVWTRAALVHKWRQGWAHRTGHEQPPGLQSLLRALCYAFREGKGGLSVSLGDVGRTQMLQGGFMWDMGCSRLVEVGHGIPQECEAALGLLQNLKQRLWFIEQVMQAPLWALHWVAACLTTLQVLPQGR